MRRTTLILTIVAALAIAAPAAQARPAGDMQSAPGPHLTAGQLHRIDGPQPVALAPESPADEIAPVTAAPDGGSNTLVWGLAFVPFLLLAGYGGIKFASSHDLLPGRRAHA